MLFSLALSSRNKYLDSDGYNKALTIHKMLEKVKELYGRGVTNVKILNVKPYFLPTIMN